jgi:FkbM family methyltransferase
MLLSLTERLHRLAETLVTPGGLTALRTWRPMSLAAFRLVRSLADDGWAFATVLDVGANAGQFARACVGAWPAVRVIAFEPQPEAAARLEAAVGAVGHLEVHVVALGAEDGTTRFFPHQHSLSSSVLPVADDARGERWARELPCVRVPIKRLDSALAGEVVARPCLLKLDTQGFELEVIAGAGAVLDQVDALLVESAFDPRYTGQPPFSKLHEALQERGWMLVRPLDFRRESDGRIVEADLLYRRHGSVP